MLKSEIDSFDFIFAHIKSLKKIIMKRLVLSVFVLVFALNGFSQAGDLDSKFANYMVETERRTIFMENMNFNAADSKLFWEVYDAYEAELGQLRTRYLENLKKYAEMYGDMNNEQASIWMKEEFNIDADHLKLRKKYYKKMDKELGAKVATRFIQIDQIISMAISLSVLDQIPIVGE
jgi:uncharacterized protein YutD